MSDSSGVVGEAPFEQYSNVPVANLMQFGTCLSTVGDCAFPVAAARVWNTPPAEVTCSPSLSTFKRRLKTVLFACSYPNSSGHI